MRSNPRHFFSHTDYERIPTSYWNRQAKSSFYFLATRSHRRFLQHVASYYLLCSHEGTIPALTTATTSAQRHWHVTTYTNIRQWHTILFVSEYVSSRRNSRWHKNASSNEFFSLLSTTGGVFRILEKWAHTTPLTIQTSSVHWIQHDQFTCAQKLTNSQLNLPHGTKKVMKKLQCVSKKDTTQPPVIISTIVVRFQ